jgi:hypothetical protein
MPSRPSFVPTSAPSTSGAKSGGLSDAGVGGVGKLNAVDITLIVFFTIFGAVLLLACAYLVVDHAKGQIADNNNAAEVANTPMHMPSAEYHDEDE